MNHHKRKLRKIQGHESNRPLKKIKPSKLLLKDFDFVGLPLVCLDIMCHVRPIIYYKSLMRVSKKYLDVFRRWISKQKDRLIDELGDGSDKDINPFVKGFVLRKTPSILCNSCPNPKGCISNSIQDGFNYRNQRVRKCRLCRLWPRWTSFRSIKSETFGWCRKCFEYYESSTTFKRCPNESCNWSLILTDVRCDYCMKTWCRPCAQKNMDNYEQRSIKQGNVFARINCFVINASK
jgi:hypothetical protein